MGQPDNKRIYMCVPVTAIDVTRVLDVIGYGDAMIGHDHGPDVPWLTASRKELREFAACEALHLPFGWEQNRLSRLLHHLALDLGMVIEYGRQA